MEPPSSVSGPAAPPAAPPAPIRALLCSLCKRDYTAEGPTQPRVLECLHTFCLNCCLELADKTPGGQCECPTCHANVKYTTPLSEKSFKKNFVILDVIEERKHRPQPEGDGPAPIFNCETEDCTTPATVYCALCKQSLCPGCDRTVHKILKGHHPIPVAEKGRAILEESLKTRRQTVVHCSVHEGTPAQLYCKPCAMPICYLCKILPAHASHEVSLLSEEFNRMRDKLLEMCSQAENRIAESRAVIEASRSEDDLRAKLTRELTTMVEQLHTAIERRKEEIMSGFSQNFSAKLAEMAEKNANLSQQIASLEEVVRFARGVTTQPTSELAEWFPKAKSRLETLLFEQPMMDIRIAPLPSKLLKELGSFGGIMNSTEDGWTWDPNDKESTLQLTENNRTIVSTVSTHQSVVGTVGWSSGIHRWRVRIIGGPHWTGIGVRAKPRTGGTDYESSYGGAHCGQWFRGPTGGGYQGSGGITFTTDEIMTCELNCDDHTFVLTSASGQTLTVRDLAATALFPWINLHGNLSLTLV